MHRKRNTMNTFYQSKAYGSLFQRTQHYTVLYQKNLIYLEGINPNLYFKRSYLYKLLKHLLRFVSWEFIARGIPSTSEFTTVISQRDKYTKMILSPDFQNGVFDFIDSTSLIEKGFSPVSLQTILLHPGDYASFYEYERTLNNSLRKNIRKYQDSVHIRPVESFSDIQRAYAIYKETSKRKRGFIVESFNHFVTLVEMKEITFYAAWYKNEMLSIQGVVHYETSFLLIGVSTSSRAREKKIPSTDILQHYIIQKAFQDNISYIDWAGYEENSSDLRQQAISAFKRKWSEEVISYTEYHFVRESGVIRCMRKLHELWISFTRSNNEHNSFSMERAVFSQNQYEALLIDAPKEYLSVLRNQSGFFLKKIRSKKLSPAQFISFLQSASDVHCPSNDLVQAVELYASSKSHEKALQRYTESVNDFDVRIRQAVESYREQLQSGELKTGEVMYRIKKELGPVFNGKRILEIIEEIRNK